MKNTETLLKPTINHNELIDDTLLDSGLDESIESLRENREIGDKISQEFKELWKIYEGRRIGNTMQYGKTTIEDDVIATRYFDGENQQHAIEETYWRTSLYGPNQHEGHTEMLFINISSPGEDEYQIVVGEDHQTKVLRRPEGADEWGTASHEVAATVLSEFFHRTLIAADVHSQRTPEEKAAADEDARQLVLNKYPILGNKKTSEE